MTAGIDKTNFVAHYTARTPAPSHAVNRDPSERALGTPVGGFLERSAGDICSVLGIVGAAVIIINRRSPTIEGIGAQIVNGSMAAAVVDTAIQGRNLLVDDGEGATKRGHKRSTFGTVMYAATGIIPAASFAATKGLHPHPTRGEMMGIAMLAVNGVVLGYELLHRVPGIVDGTEDLSGYGSLLASLGGFVVAHKFL